jgi:hypothetical protein
MPAKKRSAVKKKKIGLARLPKLVLILGLGLLLSAGLLGLTGVGAMQLENHDSFCASCHSEPESSYFHRESGASPVDLASFHTTKKTRCIDCHSGYQLPGRTAAMMLGAKDLVAFVSKHYVQPAPLTRPIPDANCLKCHADLPKKQDFNNHFHVFLSKWQSLDPQAATCVDCHKAHVTDGEATLAYLNQNSTGQVCQRCHSFAGSG